MKKNNRMNIIYKSINTKMKNKKYHIVGTVPECNRKNVKRGTIDTNSTHIYDGSLSWLGADTLIKSARVKRALKYKWKHFLKILIMGN